jgi:hypothetical protein
MRNIPLYILVLLVLCVNSNCSQPDPETASFVATLGRDTLVIEQFSILPTRVDAEVIVRTPRTLYSRQQLLLDDDGGFSSFNSATYNADDLTGSPVEEETIEIVGDSLQIAIRRDTLTRNTTIRYDPNILPWFDMVHWPYEVATRQMIKAGEYERDQLMLAGSNPAIFEFRRIADNSISVKHPFRGTMYARINKAGAILSYDATATTRKLIVSRGGTLDMKDLSGKYADKGIGSLSGEGLAEARIHDANIRITFGQPSRRGRELFGGIVPWNEVWRTGANRATHFRTDHALRFGELQLPAGEYTLYSIPAPKGGTLIINSETGQNGNTYDSALDIGRIPMTIKKTNENVELFTINAVEEGDHGVLRLMWGNTVFEINFTVSE